MVKKVFQGEIFSIWQWEQELFDGTKQIFEKATRPDGARVIGVTDDKKIMLVEDSQPDREPLFGMAGGQVEEGESPEEAAKREFLEETGYEVSSLTPLYIIGSFARLYFTMNVFIGKHLKKVREPQQSAGEKIELKFFTFEEFLSLGHNERLRDTRLRIMLLEAQLDPKKKEQLYNMLYE